MMNHTLASRPRHHTDRLPLCRGGWGSGDGWSSQGNTSWSLNLESRGRKKNMDLNEL